MSFTEDFTGFFSNAEFADDILLVTQAVTVQGIFMSPEEMAALANSDRALSPVQVHLSGPALLLPESAVSDNNLVEGQSLTRNGVTWVVATPPLRSGDGLATVYLTEPNANNTAESWKR